MKRAYVIVIMILISLFGCTEIDSKAEDRYSSVEAYLKTVDDTLIKKKELGNAVVIITESEASKLVEHILIFNDSREYCTFVHSEIIDVGQTGISIIERAFKYSNVDSGNYIILIINDEYLMEKGGAIYFNNKSSGYLKTYISFIIKPQIIQMDKSRVYIIENIYTMKVLSQEEENSDKLNIESTSKTVDYTDSFEMMNIESINITDPGGTLLYHYLFDD